MKSQSFEMSQPGYVSMATEGHSLVQRLKLSGWTEEWAKKHGFKWRLGIS